jgi:hypothetical protein
MRDIESSGFDCELQDDEELRTFDLVATPPSLALVSL